MATGWAPDGAVQDQIDDTVTDGVQRARARMPSGPSETHCVDCDEPISQRRLQAVPWATRCIHCQENADGSPHQKHSLLPDSIAA